MSHYEILYSRNGTDFEKARRVEAKNTSPAYYEWLHQNPGSGLHFYKVNAIDEAGKILVSKVVRVTLGGQVSSFTVYPNPIGRNPQITIALDNLPAGTYSIQFMDMAGRMLKAHTLQYPGGSAAQLIALPKQLAAGKYFIRLSGNGINEVRAVMKL
jgi:hypothetical protein